MRRRWMKAGSYGLALGILAVLASAAEGQCNFQGTAEASVIAHDGGVVSDHFGQITNVNCIHSRNMRLRVNTLKNNTQIFSKDVNGGKANLSATMFYSLGFPTCDGQWSSGTKFGTTFLGVLVGWLDTGVSGLTSGYCLPDGGGGGGGGGGIGGCSVSPGETTTYSLSADGVEETTGGEGGLGLPRSVERPEGRFVAEEWAVVSSDTGERRVEFASSDRFVSHVEEAPRLLYRRAGGGPTILIVEAADHPLNHRFMPTPRVANLEVAVDWGSREDTQEFWFRAEMAETGGVDRLLILDSSDPAGNSAVRDALEDRLDLQHADARRHRTVVFGRAVVSPSGTLSVEDSIVLVPQCCCGTDEPFCI